MRVLITGGAGFIGSNFVHYWVKNHSADEVIVLDALTYAGNESNIAALKDTITFINGDITDEATVTTAMAGVDTVVHFAAESHNDRAIADPYIFTRTNVFGTHVLLEAARKAGVQRFHHISTDEVFGDIPLSEHWKFNETTRYNPRSPYSASKAGSDHIVRAYFETFKLPITISNCSNNFGPFQHPEKLIPRFIIRLLQGQKTAIYGKGDQVRDWLYVEDHCRAIDAILQKGKIGETYCVGGMTTDITNLEVTKKVLDILGLSEDRIEYVTDRPGHDAKYAIDWTKIKNELGWEPLHDFDTWLKTTVEWYQNNEAWWQSTFNEAEQFYKTKGEQVVNKN
jgi:dTDP-glucose 4,6-dehydratase